MQDHKPEPRDRTPIYLALIAAVATITAALIGVLPNLVNPRSAPAPIVITATSAPTQAALATATVPAPPTNAPVSPTSAPPTPTLAPTETIISPTLTIAPPTVAPSPSPDETVRLLLVNNLASAMEFFADDTSLTTIPSGAYQPLKVPRGRHVFKQCVVGTDYSQSGSCFEKAYELAESPDTWVMFDGAHPLTAKGDVILLVLNRASIPQDLYLDGEPSETVAAGGYAALTLSQGAHTIQPCAPGMAPPSAECGARIPLNASQPTETFLIHGE